MKDIAQIRVDFNESISGCYERYKQALEDERFAKIPGSQWAGSDAKQFENKPKPENNRLARQINRILGQYQRLALNAKIIPGSDEATEEDAKTLQGRWRNDFNMSDGIEALNNAADEAFHGGFGAFKLVAEYENEDDPSDDYQRLSVKPIYSAASCVFFSAGAIRKDKRDSNQCWHLLRVNRKEFEEEYGVSLSSWSSAIDFFDWQNDTSKDVYVCHYYEVVHKKVRIYDFGVTTITKEGRTYYDEFNQKMDKEDAKRLIEENPHTTRSINSQYVEYALMDGDKFLEKPRKLPFRTVPVIPQYGYHTVINGIEYFCGEVARQRDNQRFANMGFGAMMQVLAEDQVSKPEYLPEQIQRFVQMHAEKTTKNFPYLLSDPVKDKDGNITHVGPIGQHVPPQLGTGFAAALDMLNQQINEQGGTGQSTLPSNVSADAVQQINERQDDSYQILFQNAEQSLKVGCEVWIPAAQRTYFQNERNIRIMGPDDQFTSVATLQYSMDPRTMIYGPFMNSARGRYDVVVKAGESHKASKEADKADAIEVLQFADTTTPVGQMALLSAILATSGEGTRDARRMARMKQIEIMVSSGIDPKPDDEEEMMMVQRVMQKIQAQSQAQDPNMVLAMAEQGKAIAEQQNSQTKMIEAETKRIDVLSKAQERGANIQKIQTEAGKNRLEIAQSMGGLLTGFRQ